MDCSLVIEEDGHWLGLLPAAYLPESGREAAGRRIASHPGITYGGVIHQGALLGGRMLEAFEAIIRHYREAGAATLVYKVVPHFYHRVPAQDDLYALFRLGARRLRCDLSSTIDLAARRAPTERRRRSLGRAVKQGIVVRDGVSQLGDFWNILSANLARRHNAKPVHSLAEIELLADRFPAEIRCYGAYLHEEMLAGTVLFATPVTLHAQYIAATEEGMRTSALDAVFDHLLNLAAQEGYRWFDFGISTEKQSFSLNEGLYRFKSEFGGGGTVHEIYELDLRQ